jgi:hypothetical protein
MDKDHFWQAKTFIYLATFAIWSKNVQGIGKCKSYNAKHGSGGLLVWTMDKALAKKYQPNGVCVCVHKCYMIVDVGCQR